MVYSYLKRLIAILLVSTLASGGLASVGWADAPRKSLRPVERPSGKAVVATKAGQRLSVSGADTLVAAAKLGNGKVGFAVADVKSGLVLETREASLGQPPASVTKAITALYALDTLGAGHRFVTRLVATGPVSGGVLKGDLVLLGGGDPLLDTDAVAEMARRLKAAGVSKVTGRFIVASGALPKIKQIDPDQPGHVGYNPAVSGLSLNSNRVHFEWKRGNKGWVTSMDARSDRHRPPVNMAKMQIVKRQLPVYTYADKGGVDQWTVASGALGKGGSRWLPVRQPELYAGEVFRYFARAQGITLGKPQLGKATRGGTALVSHQSDDLRSILRGMLKYSNNLTAEMVGLAATIKRTGRMTTLKSSAGEMNRWAKRALKMGNPQLVDHSGLGDASRMTAQDMTHALVTVHKSGALKPILKKIFMRYDNGKINKGHPIKVYAKTGTLNFVSALAGYMTAADGTEMAFAIFAADSNKRAAIKRADREIPQGARGWNKRAKQLQQKLIERWGTLYGT